MRQKEGGEELPEEEEEDREEENKDDDGGLSKPTVSKHIWSISFQGGYTTHFHPNSTLLKGWSFVGSCFYPSLQNTKPSVNSFSCHLFHFFVNFYLCIQTDVCVCVYTAGHVYIYMQNNPTINTSLEGRDLIHSQTG